MTGKLARALSRFYLPEFAVSTVEQLWTVALVSACVLSGLAPGQVQAQNITLAPVITTVAGGGIGYGGDGGPAAGAALANPEGVAVDSAGNLYIADTNNARVRKVDTGGIITTVAGNGTPGYSGDGGAATSAELNLPTGVAVDSAGDLYIADTGNARVRKVDTSGTITTVAGNGTAGYSGDGGPATSAELFTPLGVTVDSAGNLYLADSGESRIRKVDTGGTITTFAGNGDSEYTGDGGPATNAGLSIPYGVTADTAGNLYIADNGNECIRKVDSTGIITTVAGNGTRGYSGDGGPAISAELNAPYGVTIDTGGNLYVADANNAVIRKVDASGTITTVAGNGTPGYSGDGGPATSAELSIPYIAAVDGAGNLYIADQGNSRIRKVGKNGAASFGSTNVGASSTQNVALSINTELTVSSVQTSGDYSVLSNSCATNAALPAGTICTLQVQFTPSKPGQRWFPLVVTDSNSNRYSFGLQGTGMGSALAFTPGIISTVAGDGGLGYSGDGGPATNAALNHTYAVTLDSAGNLYIADAINQRVRKVDSDGNITTVAGNGIAGYNGDNIAATSAELWIPVGVAVDSARNLYIADCDNHRVRKVDAGGIISTVAGNGTGGYSGDGGAATSAELWNPFGVAVDSAGNLYIADSRNQRVRKVDGSGIISTVAGNGTGGYSGDNIPANSAELWYPLRVAVDSAGNLYIADSDNQRVRKVDASGMISTVAGNGTGGYSGDDGAATSAELSFPDDVAVDSAGNLYIADSDNQRVRKVDAGGIISTVAGNGTGGYSGDGGAATTAELSYPYGVAVDSAGNVYIADFGNNRVRKVDATTSALSFSSLNVGQISNPQSVAVSDVGNAPLNFSSLLASSNFVLQSVGNDCATGTPLPVGATCNLGIAFAPQMAGNPLTGTLTIADDAFNSPQIANLTGTATNAAVPTVGLSASSLSFGNWAVGTTSTAQSSTLTNTGNAALSITTIAASGDFALATTGTSCPYAGGIVNAGSSCTIDVTFTPTTTGTRAGNVTITDNAGDSPEAVMLSGTGFTNTTWAITSLADDGSAGTLRYAIANANSGDTISLNNLTGTITLTQGQLEISKNLTISGPSASKLTVSGNNSTTVFLVDSGSATTITGLTIANGNSIANGNGGGGIWNRGTLTVNNAVITNNSTGCNCNGGGGIRNDGNLTVGSSTFVGDSAAYGGAIGNWGTLAVINSTFSGNGATYGGGIFSGAGGTVVNSTFWGNHAGGDGPAINGGGSLTVKSTLFANNSLTDGVGNPYAPGSCTAVVSAGYNLSDDNYCSAFLTQASDLNNTPANVDPNGLKDNGGPTQTIALVYGSPAIDAIPVSPTNYCTDVSGNPITVDQRGIARPQGAACDIGAVERLPGVSTSVILASSANPSSISQSVTFTATVAPSSGTGTPTGTVTFSDGTTTLGPGTLNASRQATYTTSSLAQGTHSITATYDGDSQFNGSTSAATSQIVNKVSTSTGLVSSLSPSTYGQSVTFTATVAPNSGTGTPTGTVTFSDGATTLGSGTLNTTGQATYTTASLSIGTHSITASYSGDLQFNGSTSAPISQIVNKVSTSTGLASSLRPSTYGQSVTFTATVAPNSGTGTPTGTVTFNDGATTLGSGTLNASGQATYTTASLSIGTHSMTASYSGDLQFNGSTSGTVSQVVNKFSTSTALASTVNPTTFGQSATSTATVSSSGGTPTGAVTFYDGATALGTGSLNASGQAALSTAGLSAGTHSITAAYGGSSTFAASTSALLMRTVTKANTAAAITAHAPNPSVAGQGVSVSFSIAPVAPGAGAPTGNVTVTDAAGDSCTAAVAAGSCSLPITSSGAKKLTASYAGDSNFKSSTSAGVTQNVWDFSISAGPTPQTIKAGTKTTYKITLTSLGGFTGNVALSCGGVPSGSTCAISPNTVSLGSKSTTSTATIQTGKTTPKGTYTLTFTATYGTGAPTAGGLTHAVNVVLTLN